MKLELRRHAYLSNCTLGWLTGGGLKLATIEDAWRLDPDGPGGQRREGSLLESCVPDGLYELMPHNGTKWKDTWALVNPQLGVWHQDSHKPAGLKDWGRSAILLHSGISEKSSLGCIIVGLSHAITDNSHRILDSAAALNQLRDTLVSGRHQLQIRAIAGTAETP